MMVPLVLRLIGQVSAPLQSSSQRLFPQTSVPGVPATALQTLLVPLQEYVPDLKHAPTPAEQVPGILSTILSQLLSIPSHISSLLSALKGLLSSQSVIEIGQLIDVEPNLPSLSKSSQTAAGRDKSEMIREEPLPTQYFSLSLEKLPTFSAA